MDVLYTYTEDGTVACARKLSSEEASAVIFGAFENLADDADPMAVQSELMKRVMAATQK